MRIEPATLARIVQEFQIASACLPWQAQYGAYQNGKWLTVSLMNGSADKSDNLIADGNARDTELMSRFPSLRSFLNQLGLSVMWMRLAQMGPGSMLYEHVDYTELDPSKPRLRLHLPLTTNPEASLIFPGYKVHIPSGYLWAIDPRKYRHGAINSGNHPRTHLLIDCYVNDWLAARLSTRSSEHPSSIETLPILTSAMREDLLVRSSRLAGLNLFESAEVLLLKTFLQFNLGGETSYDFLLAMYSGLSANAERFSIWSTRKNTHLGL